MFSDTVHGLAAREDHWNTTYETAAGGRNAVSWMTRLYPLMGERRQGQIDVALENFEYRYGIGSTSNNAKLNEKKVRYTKRELAKKQRTQKSLAEEFGVDKKTITLIKQGKTWGHVMLDDD